MTDDSRPNFFHIGGDDSGIHPSGVAWPPALRRKLGLDSPPPEPSSSSSSSSPSSKAPAVDPLTNPSDPSTASRPPPSNRSFTAEQLRKYIHQGYAALSSLQRQLHRGEESYFEETYNHGNIFAGFDNIWIDAGNNNSSGGNSSGNAAGDAAGVGVGGGAGGPSAVGGADVTVVGGGNAGGSSSNKAAPARKMPGDHRWFSTSCGSVVATGDGRIAALERVSLLERPPAGLVDRDRASAGTSASREGVSNATKTIQEEKVDVAAKKSQSTLPKHDTPPKTALPKPLVVKSEPSVTTSSTAAEATTSATKKQSTETSKPTAPASEAKSTPAATSSLPPSSTMAAPIPRKSSSSSTASTGSAPASKDNNLMTGSIPRKRPAIPVDVPSASNTVTSTSSKTVNVSAATTSSTEQGKKKSGKKRKHS